MKKKRLIFIREINSCFTCQTYSNSWPEETAKWTNFVYCQKFGCETASVKYGLEFRLPRCLWPYLLYRPDLTLPSCCVLNLVCFTRKWEGVRDSQRNRGREACVCVRKRCCVNYLWLLVLADTGKGDFVWTSNP